MGIKTGLLFAVLLISSVFAAELTDYKDELGSWTSGGMSIMIGASSRHYDKVYTTVTTYCGGSSLNVYMNLNNSVHTVNSASFQQHSSTSTKARPLRLDLYANCTDSLVFFAERVNADGVASGCSGDEDSWGFTTLTINNTKPCGNNGFSQVKMVVTPKTTAIVCGACGSGIAYSAIGEINFTYYAMDGTNDLPEANITYYSPVYALFPSWPINTQINITAHDDEGDTIYYSTDDDTFGFIPAGDPQIGYLEDFGSSPSLCSQANWAVGIGDGYFSWSDGDYYYPAYENGAYTMNSTDSPKNIVRNGDCALSFGQYSKPVYFTYGGLMPKIRDVKMKVGMDFSTYSVLNITFLDQFGQLANLSVHANGTQIDLKYNGKIYKNTSRFVVDEHGISPGYIQLLFRTYPNGTITVLSDSIPPTAETRLFDMKGKTAWNFIKLDPTFLVSIDDFIILYPNTTNYPVFTTVKPTTVPLDRYGWNYFEIYVSDSYHQPYDYVTKTVAIEVLPTDYEPKEVVPVAGKPSLNEVKSEFLAQFRKDLKSLKMGSGGSIWDMMVVMLFPLFILLVAFLIWTTHDLQFSFVAASGICLGLSLILWSPLHVGTFVVGLAFSLTLLKRGYE